MLHGRHTDLLPQDGRSQPRTRGRHRQGNSAFGSNFKSTAVCAFVRLRDVVIGSGVRRSGELVFARAEFIGQKAKQTRVVRPRGPISIVTFELLGSRHRLPELRLTFHFCAPPRRITKASRGIMLYTGFLICILNPCRARVNLCRSQSKFRKWLRLLRGLMGYYA